MEKKASILIISLLLVVIDDLMVQTEASLRNCDVVSTSYQDMCHAKKSFRCTKACLSEGYPKGRCYQGKCHCKPMICHGTSIPRSPHAPIGGDEGDGQFGGGVGDGHFGGGRRGGEGNGHFGGGVGGGEGNGQIGGGVGGGEGGHFRGSVGGGEGGHFGGGVGGLGGAGGGEGHGRFGGAVGGVGERLNLSTELE